MAHRPSDTSPYTYSARALIRRKVITVLPYIATPAPDVNVNVKPTILRSFRDDLKVPKAIRATSVARSVSSTTDSDRGYSPFSSTAYATPPPSSPHLSYYDDDDVTPGPSATPSFGVSRATSAPPIRPVPSRATDPVKKPQPVARSVSRSSLRENEPASGVLTRSASRSNLRESEPASVNTERQPGVLTRSASRRSLRESEPVSANTERQSEVLTRSPSRDAPRIRQSKTPNAPFPWVPPIKGLPQGPTNDDDGSGYKRYYTWCRRTDVEKAANTRSCTAWWGSFAELPRSGPPAGLIRRGELLVGDLFCHWHSQSPNREPQMWVYTKVTVGQLQWKPVCVGYVRSSDKRILCIADNGEPAFYTDQWFRRKEQDRLARMSKGKARASVAI
ncbi:hypothetical protein C8Q76DRAFT_695828 [Earliella scabrosa]|nr:hypothetical protein C8Q76DRAFT_695828 [Earliella scabrosa]